MVTNGEFIIDDDGCECVADEQQLCGLDVTDVDIVLVTFVATVI